jgi:hypothetical protein
LEELRQTSPTAGATSVENKGATTIVSILRQRAAEKGQAPLFTLLKDGEKIDRTLSFEQLDGRARSIAARLQALSLAKGWDESQAFGTAARTSAGPPGLTNLAEGRACIRS